jgi:hypothetical protein
MRVISRWFGLPERAGHCGVERETYMPGFEACL